MNAQKLIETDANFYTITYNEGMKTRLKRHRAHEKNRQMYWVVYKRCKAKLDYIRGVLNFIRLTIASSPHLLHLP